MLPQRGLNHVFYFFSRAMADFLWPSGGWPNAPVPLNMPLFDDIVNAWYIEKNFRSNISIGVGYKIILKASEKERWEETWIFRVHRGWIKSMSNCLFGNQNVAYFFLLNHGIVDIIWVSAMMLEDDLAYYLFKFSTELLGALRISYFCDFQLHIFYKHFVVFNFLYKTFVSCFIYILYSVRDRF